MATAKQSKKDPVDIVHQNAIHVETIKKENRSQKLYTNFSINPFKTLHVFTDKPTTGYTHDNVEDRKYKPLVYSTVLRCPPVFIIAFTPAAFIKALHDARLEPTKKYAYPQTESQEIGWISTPLIVSDRSDRRVNWPRQNSEITKYMDAAWRLKEQTQNLG
uniref:Cilia and flagella associated protein 144 n=1 Tax=Esox lucius TaxID=8010 RepID=A0AAY5K768_ESOLU